MQPKLFLKSLCLLLATSLIAALPARADAASSSAALETLLKVRAVQFVAEAHFAIVETSIAEEQANVDNLAEAVRQGKDKAKILTELKAAASRTDAIVSSLHTIGGLLDYGRDQLNRAEPAPKDAYTQAMFEAILANQASLERRMSDRQNAVTAVRKRILQLAKAVQPSSK